MTPGDEFWTAGANMSLSSSAKLASAQKEFVAEFSQDNSPLQKSAFTCAHSGDL